MGNRRLQGNFLIILAVDIFLLFMAWYGAHLLRFNFEMPEGTGQALIKVFPIVLGIKVIVFYYFDLYRGMWRYTSTTDLLNILKAGCVSSLVLSACVLFMGQFGAVFRSVLIMDWILTLLLISACRMGIRLFFSFHREDFSFVPHGKVNGWGSKEMKRAKNLLIIGAGDAGEMICREIRANRALGYNVVGFVDDNPLKVGMKIHGSPVLGTTDALKAIVERRGVHEALIAIPSATSGRMRKIVSRCNESGIPFKTVPGLGELLDGKVTVKAIRDFAYRDLLGRDDTRLDEERIGGYLEKGRILITGAGGSIGSELCRQICRYRPACVILYERAESPLYEVSLDLKRDFPDVEIIPLLADIRDRQQLSKAFAALQPEVVFHAAAYKHVPMMELQPWKAIKNNVLGTRNVIDICRQFSVERFVFVSTDKAVRAVNVMGASKRAAELLVQSQNGNGRTRPRCMTVRFGNVIGSAASVVTLFKKQIDKGGPVTVTHPDMTRFFMTIPEACQLILQAGAMGEGGEIFILNMGTPVRILDLARDLIRLSGFDPDIDIKIEYIGLRPGEKLHEELFTEGEGIVPTSHKNIMVLRGKVCDQSSLNTGIDELAQLAYLQDSDGIKAKLREIVPEYEPNGRRSGVIGEIDEKSTGVKCGLQWKGFDENQKSNKDSAASSIGASGAVN